MYLKQKSLKISGSKAQFIDRVLIHARGNLSARDAVEEMRRYANVTQTPVILMNLLIIQSPVILMTLLMI